MDKTDRRILKLLEANAKLRMKEIAADLQMSTTPVFERIKKLEKAGIIEGYHARLNRKKMGEGLLAICSISLQQHRAEYIETFEREIIRFPEVVECYHVAGQFDYLVKVTAVDMDAYHHFVTHHLASLKNIAKVQSSFVMTEIKPVNNSSAG